MTQAPKPASLKRYGRAFQATPLSAAADARIRKVLDVPPRSSRRWAPLLWATPLVAACALLGLWARSTWKSQACEVTQQAMHTRYSGSCDVELRAMTLELEPSAVVEEAESQVRLARGTARFTVRKVPAGQPPVRIALPDATIEVLGTEFTVTVSEEASRVHLHEGHIRFLHEGQGAVDMTPGQVLTFEARTGKTAVVTLDANVASPSQLSHDIGAAASASAASPELTTAPAESAPPAATLPPRLEVQPPSASVEPRSPTPSRAAASAAAPSTDALQTVLQLRAEGRYDEALLALQQVNADNARAREVVDYERATLTDARSPAAACPLYRRHLQQFPSSRYRAAVLAKLARCNEGSLPPGSR